jgi:hypothetical protein
MQEGNSNIIFIIPKTNRKPEKHFKQINTEIQNTSNWEERRTVKRNGGDKMESMVQLDSKVQKKKEKSLVK